jgi:hypothetical protein
VLWLAGKEPVRRRLEALLTREHLDDYIRVQPLPNSVQVRSW